MTSPRMPPILNSDIARQKFTTGVVPSCINVLFCSEDNSTIALCREDNCYFDVHIVQGIIND